jgi:hypothetical protein
MKHPRFIMGLSVAMILVCIAGIAEAQTVTLTPSVTSGNGSLSTSLTWSTTPAAQSCTASGHASWTGTKAASGSQDLPAITLSGSYQLTLSCVWPGDNTATVRWTAPTTNTDGTPLAKCASGDSTGPCLAGFRVYRRVGSSDMSSAEMTLVTNPNATSHVFTGLGVGVQNFGVEAINGNGVPSAMSNIASKTITASTTRTESVTVTVNPKPSPTVVTIE